MRTGSFVSVVTGVSVAPGTQQSLGKWLLNNYSAPPPAPPVCAGDCVRPRAVGGELRDQVIPNTNR